MRRHILGLLGLWLLAAAGVSAADFWTEKPFLQWSDKDTEKMMSGSPWAVVMSVALPPNLPVPSGDVGGGRGGGRGGDDSFGPGPRRIRLTISWRSALPIKQALVRSQVGQGGTPTADQSTFLTQDEQFYVIGITGLPPQYIRPGADTTVEALLRRKNKADIPVQQAGSQPGAGGGILLLGFPRGEIMPEDAEIELVAKFDRLEIKRKFKLAAMMFEGKLEL